MSLDTLRRNLEGGGIPFQTEVFLAPYTTFRIGGPCRILAKPANAAQLRQTVLAAEEAEVPSFFLGNGSDLLISDNGYNGIVILTSGLSQIGIISGTKIVCGSGVTLAKLCSFACSSGLSGLEFVWGIPGSVGGAVYMNAGAYGGEIKDSLSSCTFLEEDGEEATLSREELQFSYRKSPFTGTSRAILCAAFILTPDDPAAIRERMDGYMARRAAKQPLEYPSAGSVFKRPAGMFAGTLIEQCGLKGRQVGGARVSEKHAGFIINTGGATCRDVSELIGLIQRTVAETTGYRLECEIQKIGNEKE